MFQNYLDDDEIHQRNMADLTWSDFCVAIINGTSDSIFDLMVDDLRIATCCEMTGEFVDLALIFIALGDGDSALTCISCSLCSDEPIPYWFFFALKDAGLWHTMVDVADCGHSPSVFKLWISDPDTMPREIAMTSSTSAAI